MIPRIVDTPRRNLGESVVSWVHEKGRCGSFGEMSLWQDQKETVLGYGLGDGRFDTFESGDCSKHEYYRGILVGLEQREENGCFVS